MNPPESRTFEVHRLLPGGDDLTLRGETAGSGPPVVLLHGLTATRRYVTQGSKHLQRHGWTVHSYDARGHGESDPAPDYDYASLVGDLEVVVGDLGIERPILVGSSMGAATAMAWALDNPTRVTALVQVTPAYTGGEGRFSEETWDRAAEALDREDVEAFIDTVEPPDMPEQWRELSRKALRQRMERHRDLHAVADAVRGVTRSSPFESIDALDGLEVPTLVVGTRDEADRLHPLAVAEEYATRLPHAELVVEDEGESPLAWQGARLSREIARFLEEHAS